MPRWPLYLCVLYFAGQTAWLAEYHGWLVRNRVDVDAIRWDGYCASEMAAIQRDVMQTAIGAGVLVLLYAWGAWLLR